MKTLARIALFAVFAMLATPASAQTAVYHTTAPTYTNGATAGLEVDVNGNLKVVGATGTSASQTQGSVAHDAVDSGNPVKIGGYASATAPAAVADGDRVNLWLGQKGQSFTAIVSQTAGAYADVGGDGDTEVFPASLAVRSMLKLRDPVTGFAVSARGDVNGLLVQSGTVATRWRYTSGATPILSNTTTAVTIKTAAGAGVRNVIDSCQLTTTAFGASVPLALRDGAAGTVMFALTVPTAGFLQPVVITFDPPLTGTANTLTEVVTTTANTTGTVTLNCQGHTES